MRVDPTRAMSRRRFAIHVADEEYFVVRARLERQHPEMAAGDREELLRHALHHHPRGRRWRSGSKEVWVTVAVAAWVAVFVIAMMMLVLRVGR